MDEDIRKNIEAILFSLGRKTSVQELSKMTKIKDNGKIVACLIELKKKYNEDPDNSLMILQDGDNWKLTIKDQYINVAKEIGIDTELSKSVMETLAIIAYKNPIVQSDVIKVRTNKAYDHLKELEELGYITREVWGRSKKIKLAPKFFDYFDLPPESLKENFSTVEKLEKTIEEKEHQLHERKQERESLLEEKKRKELELDSKNIYMEIKVPENYKQEKENDSLKPENIIITEETIHDKNGLDIIKKQKIGELEVIDEEPTEEELKEIQKNQQKNEEQKENQPLEPELQRLGDLEVVDEEPIEEDVEETKENQEDFDEDVDLENSEEETPEEEINSIQEAKDLLNQELNQDTEEQSNLEGNEENNIDKDIEYNEENLDSIKDDLKETSDIVTPEQLAKAVEDALKKQKEEQQGNLELKQEQEDNIEKNDLEEDSENKQDDEDLSDFDKSQMSFDDDQVEEELTKKTELKEDQIFEMSGIPKNIMEEIEEKSDEILGLTKVKKIKEDIFDE
jgi:segregation and condensation protein B